jgi:hypothetical protein
MLTHRMQVDCFGDLSAEHVSYNIQDLREWELVYLVTSRVWTLPNIRSKGYRQLFSKEMYSQAVRQTTHFVCCPNLRKSEDMFLHFRD